MTTSIAMLAFDGISPFHLSVPHAVFGVERPELGVPRFDFRVCATEPGLLCTSLGLGMHVTAGLEAFDGAGLVIVPSWQLDLEPAPALLEALRRAHASGTRIVGLCLGSFVLAEAGLLNGLSATTHWMAADSFARRYPAVRFDPQVLYIDHGQVVTSAGMAAGLDCCLHLLRQLVGAEIAHRVARRLVIPPHRQGSQAQFIDQPSAERGVQHRLGKVMDWARAHLSADLSIDLLAGQASMSRRTFTRQFQRATGMSVMQWLSSERVRLAQRMLETSDLGVEQIAEQCGFGGALSLRTAFARELNTTPGQYRREFRLAPGA
jgi:transcriptional regulator GlxA family with amidase domain